MSNDPSRLSCIWCPRKSELRELHMVSPEPGDGMEVFVKSQWSLTGKTHTKNRVFYHFFVRGITIFGGIVETSPTRLAVPVISLPC